jgi:hypothetical protein
MEANHRRPPERAVTHAGREAFENANPVQRSAGHLAALIDISGMRTYNANTAVQECSAEPHMHLLRQI